MTQEVPDGLVRKPKREETVCTAVAKYVGAWTVRAADAGSQEMFSCNYGDGAAGAKRTDGGTNR